MPGKTNLETVKLQLAMAFGQGAGSMLAEAAAIERLLADNGVLIKFAEKNWEEVKVPFAHYVRLLGQQAAMRAAAAGRPEIVGTDIRQSAATILRECPCYHRIAKGPSIRPRRATPR